MDICPLVPVKREAGESPARTRRCKRGALLCRKELTEKEYSWEEKAE